ncbi:MAG: FAD-dependent oxidoreductase, partial [Chthoniobacteraceae bacterium]
MIREILVLGSGSAGLIAALSLRAALPQLVVRIVRSAEIGIIGVGEGSTADLPNHLHGFLSIDPARFHAEAKPSWKLGVRFKNWGPRDAFNYTFTHHVTGRAPQCRKANGFYDFAHRTDADISSALMTVGKAFALQPNGAPDVRRTMGYHLENADFVCCLERYARETGIEFIEGTVARVETNPEGLAALHLASGERLAADLFVDASGFRSEIIRQALDEPFQSYANALFCDRAIIGGWERTDEPVLPYTTAETMDAGWAWQIEHERHVNRGYVFSSAFAGDGEAEATFRRANPKLQQTRLVKFRTGRVARNWIGNVFAIGNASGFVEPLEATALLVICQQARFLAWALRDCDGEPTPTLRASTNRIVANVWNEIRDFLAVHYRFNTRLETPFWQHCRAETALHGAQRIVDFYRENGPSTVTAIELLNPSASIFQLEGFYALLLGQKVSHRKTEGVSAEEVAHWRAH